LFRKLRAGEHELSFTGFEVEVIIFL